MELEECDGLLFNRWSMKSKQAFTDVQTLSFGLGMLMLGMKLNKVMALPRLWRYENALLVRLKDFKIGEGQEMNAMDIAGVCPTPACVFVMHPCLFKCYICSHTSVTTCLHGLMCGVCLLMGVYNSGEQIDWGTHCRAGQVQGCSR